MVFVPSGPFLSRLVPSQTDLAIPSSHPVPSRPVLSLPVGLQMVCKQGDTRPAPAAPFLDPHLPLHATSDSPPVNQINAAANLRHLTELPPPNNRQLVEFTAIESFRTSPRFLIARTLRESFRRSRSPVHLTGELR